MRNLKNQISKLKINQTGRARPGPVPQRRVHAQLPAEARRQTRKNCARCSALRARLHAREPARQRNGGSDLRNFVPRTVHTRRRFHGLQRNLRRAEGTQQRMERYV